MRPSGSDEIGENLGPSELFLKEKFIFVYQDVRGRYQSTGTDSDFVVKLIDMFPGDYPDFNAPPTVPGAPPRQDPANTIRMGGYQQLIRGEPFRGKYRKSMEKPEPFVPGQPDRIQFELPDVARTFRAGLSTDFVKATQRVYLGGADGSELTIRVLP